MQLEIKRKHDEIEKWRRDMEEKMEKKDGEIEELRKKLQPPERGYTIQGKYKYRQFFHLIH